MLTKSLPIIILNRLISTISDESLPNFQHGFWPDRCTIDMFLTVRQVQEKCLEQNVNLYSVFIDLTKALDTVNKNAPWTILRKLSCPMNLTTLIKLFLNDMTGEVVSEGEPFTNSTFHVM